MLTNINGLNVKYALFRCKDYGVVDGRGTFVCMDVKDNSVLFIVDDFMLSMVFDVKGELHKVQLMDMGIRLNSECLNDGVKYEEISPMPVHIFDHVMASVTRVIVESMNVQNRFAELHQQLFGESLSDDILSDILELMYSNPCKLGDIYTVEHYSWCYKEALKKRGLIRENGDGMFTIIT